MTAKTSDSKTVKAIDCLAVAANLEIDAKKVHELIEKTGKPVILTVKNLKSKYPELSTLPDTLPLFRLRKNTTIANVYDCSTLKIYKDDSGQSKVFDCELNPLDAEIISFKTGIAGFGIIKIGDLQLTIAISCNDDHRVLSLEMAQEFDNNEPFQDEHGNEFNVNGFVGNGTPPSEYLALVPRPETPLHSPDLLESTVYEIVASGKKSRQYDTPLLDIKDEQGKIFKNVICNSALSRIFEKNGIGAKFSISQRYKNEDKNGNTIKTSKGDKEVWKCKIKDLQDIDLSDIDIDI